MDGQLFKQIMGTDPYNWFSSWFNTPYYHILYQERDHAEAESFMENLNSYLNLPEQASILYLGCGGGHQATYLHGMGYEVTGVDLSDNNIEYAKKFERPGLKFKVRDMSKPYNQQFDAVLNLFTSFGYFDDDDYNLNTIKSIKANLNETGFGVIDFMNTQVILDNLVPEETKTVGGIDFHLKRYVENDYIIKDIRFDADGKSHHYQERIKALTLQDFELLFEQANAYLLDVFGDYKLNKFRPQTSERLVMIFK